ncbi:broad-complex isoform X5 [Apis mellifera caucasica]|nr:broad-complex isoform X5 [Apis mellifera caucasica]KAG9428843.1 broad-complex isoform X5 [Apis mellifera carnica]
MPGLTLNSLNTQSAKKLFTCQLCGKVLCSKASLKRHVADKHAERQEEYRCVICERVYCSRNSLMTHIYTYHKSRPGDIDIKFF